MSIACQDTLDEKENLDQYNFNWILPSASEDTFCGLKTHIRHLRRKKAKICELLESVSRVVSEDKETGPQVDSEDKETGKLKDGILGGMEEDDESKPEKFDEGKSRSKNQNLVIWRFRWVPAKKTLTVGPYQYIGAVSRFICTQRFWQRGGLQLQRKNYYQ